MNAPASTCGAVTRAATGNELARARSLDAEGLPLLGAVTRAGQLYTCTLPVGHEGAHREAWSSTIGVEWTDAAEVEPPRCS